MLPFFKTQFHIPTHSQFCIKKKKRKKKRPSGYGSHFEHIRSDTQPLLPHYLEPFSVVLWPIDNSSLGLSQGPACTCCTNDNFVLLQDTHKGNNICFLQMIFQSIILVSLSFFRIIEVVIILIFKQSLTLVSYVYKCHITLHTEFSQVSYNHLSIILELVPFPPVS